jgi:phosphate uptake regulator
VFDSKKAEPYKSNNLGFRLSMGSEMLSAALVGKIDMEWEEYAEGTTTITPGDSGSQSTADKLAQDEERLGKTLEVAAAQLAKNPESTKAIQKLESASAIAEEMKKKEITFSEKAENELSVLISAVNEIVENTEKAFMEGNVEAAKTVEPLEQVIDGLKDELRSGHIERLQSGLCTIDTGFVWSDILTNLERISDHCSNVAGCVIDAAHNDLTLHSSLRKMKEKESGFNEKYTAYAEKYKIER